VVQKDTHGQAGEVVLEGVPDEKLAALNQLF